MPIVEQYNSSPKGNIRCACWQDDGKDLVCEFLVPGEEPTGSAVDKVANPSPYQILLFKLNLKIDIVNTISNLKTVNSFYRYDGEEKTYNLSAIGSMDVHFHCKSSIISYFPCPLHQSLFLK